MPYQPDVAAAMEVLQKQEFAAGRYHSRRTFDPSLPPPASIDDLRANYLTEEGSRSILDMVAIADEPGGGELAGELSGLLDESPGMEEFFGAGMAEFCTVVRVPDEELLRLFGTTQPTHAMIQASSDYYDKIERGCGIYIIAYRDDQPDEIFFAGYSFD